MTFMELVEHRATLLASLTEAQNQVQEIENELQSVQQQLVEINSTKLLHGTDEHKAHFVKTLKEVRLMYQLHGLKWYNNSILSHIQLLSEAAEPLLGFTMFVYSPEQRRNLIDCCVIDSCIPQTPLIASDSMSLKALKV